MSYHISHLGQFAGSRYHTDEPAYFVDSDDLVAQTGDPKPADQFTEEEWASWCARADKATARAEQRAQKWREENA